MSPSLSPYQDFLQNAKIPLRLSCNTQSGWPMILSLWYLYEDERLFCATQETAKVVSYLKNEPRCAYEIAGDYPPYCGIRGQSRAVLDPSRGIEILEKLLIRYQGSTDTPLAKTLLAKKDNEVALILKPTTLYQWDFSNRMELVRPSKLDLETCPGTK